MYKCIYESINIYTRFYRAYSIRAYIYIFMYMHIFKRIFTNTDIDIDIDDTD